MECRVLVVEDDSTTQALLTKYLQQRGHSVVVAASGEDAVKMFTPGIFDCLLVDYWLPGFDGIECIKRVRKVDDRVGIIVVTGKKEEVEEMCGGLSVYSVVQKPVILASLHDKVLEAAELAHMSPEQEAKFLSTLTHESKKMNALTMDLMNETGFHQTQ